MNYLIQVKLKNNFSDQKGEHLRQDIINLGITSIDKVKFFPLYKFEGEIEKKDIVQIAQKLLIDPVTEDYNLINNTGAKENKNIIELEIWLKHGVTDTVAESVLKAVKDLGIQKQIKVKTGQKYVFEGKIDKNKLEQTVKRLLVNNLIQEYKIN